MDSRSSISLKWSSSTFLNIPALWPHPYSANFRHRKLLIQYDIDFVLLFEVSPHGDKSLRSPYSPFGEVRRKFIRRHEIPMKFICEPFSLFAILKKWFGSMSILVLCITFHLFAL